MNSRSLGKLRGEQQKAVDVGCRGRAGAAAGDKPGWELVSQLMAARGVAASEDDEGFRSAARGSRHVLESVENSR